MPLSRACLSERTPMSMKAVSSEKPSTSALRLSWVRRWSAGWATTPETGPLAVETTTGWPRRKASNRAWGGATGRSTVR